MALFSSPKSGRPTFLQGAVAILIFVSTAFFFWKEAERKEKLALKSNLEQVTAAQHDLERQLRELELSRSELQTTIKFQEEKIALLTQELENEKELLKDNEAKLRQKDIDIEEFKVKLASATEERDALAQRVDKQSEDIYSLKYQLETILKTKEELEKRAKELAEKGPVSLGTIVVKQNS